MRHDVQVALIERVLANIAGRTTDMGEQEQWSPVERYTDPARLAREQGTLFRRWPLLVGFSSQLDQPGAFVTHRLSGVPILVVRQKDGGLKAFLNVCRHRGTCLVEAGGGTARSFVCPYHAWTYGTDGALKGLPHADAFPTLDKAVNGLVELPVAERHGMVFVRPEPGPAFDLDAHLGAEIADDFAGFGLAGHVGFEPREFPKAMNWKLFFDSSLEGYHFQFAHRDTIAPMFHDNLTVVDWLPPNVRAVLPKRSITELEGTDPAGWDIRPHSNLLYTVFPNTIVLVQPDHVATMTVWPDGVGRTVVQGGTLVPEPPATDKARAYWRRNQDIFYDAIDEDFEMIESIQRGLAAAAQPALRLGRMEWIIEDYHRGLEAAMDEATARAAE